MLQRLDNHGSNTKIFKGKKFMDKEAARLLKRYVDVSHLNREDIRHAVGVDRSTMSRHLNGKTPLTAQKINSYAAVLGIHPHQITGVAPMQVIGHTWEQQDNFKVHVYDATQPRKLIYPDVGYFKDQVCITKYRDLYAPWLVGTVFIFNRKEMETEMTHDKCNQWCFVKFKDRKNQVRHKLCIPKALDLVPGKGMHYSLSTPGNFFEHSVETDNEGNVEIFFACPINHVVHISQTKNWKEVTEGGSND